MSLETLTPMALYYGDLSLENAKSKLLIMGSTDI